MNTKIFKNAYIAAIIALFVSYLFFYIFKIGYREKMENGRMKKYPSWYMPIAFAGIVFVAWYFFLFPVVNQPSELPKHEPMLGKPTMQTTMWLQ